jgi:hypothetical protein
MGGTGTSGPPPPFAETLVALVFGVAVTFGVVAAPGVDLSPACGCCVELKSVYVRWAS